MQFNFKCFWTEKCFSWFFLVFLAYFALPHAKIFSHSDKIIYFSLTRTHKHVSKPIEYIGLFWIVFVLFAFMSAIKNFTSAMLPVSSGENKNNKLSKCLLSAYTIKSLQISSRWQNRPNQIRIKFCCNVIAYTIINLRLFDMDELILRKFRKKATKPFVNVWRIKLCIITTTVECWHIYVVWVSYFASWNESDIYFYISEFNMTTELSNIKLKIN